MNSYQEYCPHCCKVRIVQIRKSTRREKDKTGKQRIIKIASYYCQSCHQFIRSQEKSQS